MGTTNRFESVVIIGGGAMGEAILAGLVAQRTSETLASLVVANPGVERQAYLRETYGIACVRDATEITTTPDVIILAVKPQIMTTALEQIVANPLLVGEALPLFITVAAGLKTSFYEEHLPAGARVIRTMPNMPMLVGEGAIGLCAGARANEDDVACALRIFEPLGVVEVVDESLMDAVCAVSGSGPSYVAQFVKAMSEAGSALGLSPSQSLALTLQTVAGTAKLMQERGSSPDEVVKAVTSPHGTTEAANTVLMGSDFASVVASAVHAADRRSKELSQ